MSILVNKDTRLLVQGFTGSQGTLHSEQSIKYGTNIVGGVTPGKGGQIHLNKPVVNSVEEAVNEVSPNASIIFVPAKFCKSSILEAAEAGIKLIICITEGVPTLDMLEVKKKVDELKKLSEECRTLKINKKELFGGSMTITSLGGIGGSFFTPIINFPEVAILGIGKSQRKQVFIEGKLVARTILPLSLSYDHRIIDGKEAVSFLKIVKESLEQPRRLFLNI